MPVNPETQDPTGRGSRTRRRRRRRRTAAPAVNVLTSAAGAATGTGARGGTRRQARRRATRAAREARGLTSRTRTEIGQTTPTTPATETVKALALYARQQGRDARVQNLLSLYDQGPGPINPDIELKDLLRLKKVQAHAANQAYRKSLRAQAKEADIPTRLGGVKTPASVLESELKEHRQTVKKVKADRAKKARQDFKDASYAEKLLQAGVVGAGIPGVFEGDLKASNVGRRAVFGTKNLSPLEAALMAIPGERLASLGIRGARALSAADRAVLAEGGAAARRAVSSPVRRTASAARTARAAASDARQAAARSRALRQAARQEARAAGASTARRARAEAARTARATGRGAGTVAKTTGKAATFPVRHPGQTAKGVLAAQPVLAATGTPDSGPLGAAANLIQAPTQIAQAAVEDPTGFAAATAKSARDTLFSVPPSLLQAGIAAFEALPGTPGDTEGLQQLGEAIINDFEARYGPLAEGNKEEFRNRVLHGYEIEGLNGEMIHVPGGGLTPYALDALIAAPPVGRLAGGAARSGWFGDAAQEFATAARATQRISGDLTKVPQTSRNLGVIPFQRGADRFREGVTARRAAKGDAVASRAAAEGQITPVFRKFAGARHVAATKGRAILKGRSLGGDEVGRGLLREYERNLNKEERKGAFFAIQLGIRTPDEARRWLAERITQIKQKRAQADIAEVPKRWDNVPELEQLIIDADKVFTPNLASFADRQVGRGQELAKYDPTFRNLSADVRAARPQGKLLGVARFKAASPQEFYRSFSKALEGDRGAYLSQYTPEQLEGRAPLDEEGSKFEGFFLSDDGKVGVALIRHADGKLEAGSLFNDAGPRGAGEDMLKLAVANDATYLTAFGDGLRRKYEKAGFIVKQKIDWDDQYAPAGWNYDRDGRPPVYVMERGEGEELTRDQYAHTQVYQEDVSPEGMTSIARAQRKLRDGEAFEDLDEHEQAAVRQVDDAIAASYSVRQLDPPDHVVDESENGHAIFYRGITPEQGPRTERWLKVGNVIEEPSFLSTSIDRPIAYSQAIRGSSGRGRVLLRIEVPDETKALDVNDVLERSDNEFPGEYEQLLGRGSKLEVLSVEEKPFSTVSGDAVYHEVTVRLHPAQAYPLKGPRDPRKDFLARLKEARDREGLSEAGYFPSQVRRNARNFSVRSFGGSKAVRPVKQYQGKLYDLGIEDTRVHVLAEGYLRNIKNNTNWNLVGDLFDTITIPETRNKSMFELLRWMEENGIDENTVRFVNVERFRKEDPLEALGDDIDSGDFHIDPDTIGTEALAAHLDRISATPAEAQRIADSVFGHTNDPDAFQATRGWSLVPEHEWNEITEGMKQSLASRLANIILTQKPSRWILGSLNVPWLKFQVISNGIMAGLVGGVGPVEWAKAGVWWSKLTDAEKRAVSPYLGDGSHFFPEESKLGAASTNRLLNAYRGLKESAGGKVLWASKKEGGAVIQSRDLNPFNVMFAADRTQNNFFRRAVFYNRTKREALARISENAGAATTAQNRIMGYFQLDPEGQMRALLNDPESIARNAKSVSDIMGDYTTFTRGERNYLKRYVMFYSFLRFSMRLAFYTMPVHHPVMTGLMGQLARLEAAEIQDMLGSDLLPYALGRFYMDDGNLAVDLQRANPVMNALSQTVFGYGQQGKLSGLVGLFSPWLGAAYTQLSNTNSFTGRPVLVEGETTNRSTLGIPLEDRARIFAQQFLTMFFPYRTLQEIQANGRPFGADHLVFSPRYTGYKDPEIKKAIRQRRQELPDSVAQSLLYAAFPELPQPSNDIEVSQSLRERIAEEAQQLGSDAAINQAANLLGVPPRKLKSDSGSSGGGWYGSGSSGGGWK